jgi:hypothetical protein
MGRERSSPNTSPLHLLPYLLILPWPVVLERVPTLPLLLLPSKLVRPARGTAATASRTSTATLTSLHLHHFQESRFPVGSTPEIPCEAERFWLHPNQLSLTNWMTICGLKPTRIEQVSPDPDEVVAAAALG